MSTEQSANKQSLNIWIWSDLTNHKKETNNIFREKNCGLSLTMLSCMCVCEGEKERMCVCVGNLNGSGWLVSPGSGEVRTNTSCYSWTNQVYVRICPPLSALITIWMLHNISAWKCKFLSEWKSTEGPRVKKRNKKILFALCLFI